MQAEPFVKRHLCLWLPDPLPANKAEQRNELKTASQRERDRMRLEAFALWCQRFSPRVSIERASGERGIVGSTLLLEITGLGPLFGGERGLIQKLSRALCQRHVRAHLGLADSIGAAWALAHFGNRLTTTESKAVGSNFSENLFSEDLAITLHQLPAQVPPLEALQTLPAAALRLLPHAIESLSLLGIRTVGQLTALPREQLTSRFGKEVIQSIDRVTGQLEEVLPVLPPPEETTAAWSLEFPTSDCSLLKEIFRKLVEQLQQILSTRSHILLGIKCQLKLQDRTEAYFSVALYRACGDVPHLAELLGLRLERTPLTAPVSDVVLTVTESTQREYQQLTWLDRDRSTESTDSLLKNPFSLSLDRCLERLHGRLGSRAVVQPKLRTDAIAERSVRFVPVGGRAQNTCVKKAVQATHLRPLWLHRPPQRIQVVRLDRNDRPLEFHYLGTRHTVRWIEGPERIESSRHTRHRTQHILRNYYRVGTAALQRFWIFCHSRDWFLHGEFD